eukprot:NODE_317_length_9977_cov_0.461126.p2 type:complete len:326 gc:universal NODE_317_length_9977_cov_0.461126:2005-2982(+)
MRKIESSSSSFYSDFTTIDQILSNEDPKHPLSADALLKFAKSIYADENVRFILDAKRVMSFKNLPSYKILAKRYGTCLNLPNEIQCRFVKGDLLGVEEAYCHIYEIVKTDIYPKFLKTIQIRKQLDYTRQSALWWKKRQTLNSFFSYPDPILVIDARCHSFLCTILIITSIMLSLNFGTDYGVMIYLTYGYLARFCCGPKLDFQSYFVIFMLRPLIIETNLLDVTFESGYPRRIVQLLAGLLALAASVLLYLDLVFVYCGVIGFLGLFACVNALFDYCVLCQVLTQLVKLKILPPKCDYRAGTRMIGVPTRTSKQRIDSVIVINK